MIHHLGHLIYSVTHFPVLHHLVHLAAMTVIAVGGTIAKLLFDIEESTISIIQ
jgi:hypothetical protein